MGTQTDLFLKARDSFIHSLEPKEKSRFAMCSSIEELLEDVKNIPALRKSGSRKERFISSISNFAEKLKPYFEVVGIFVQSYPEFPAIAWGAIRLALQLAGNYSSFFGNFVQTLNQVAAKLPKLEYCRDCLSDKLKDGALKKLEDSLKQIYLDLFEFLQAVVRIFTRKDGGANGTPTVVSKLFWKPFDIQFRDLLSRMELHREIVQEEIEILHWRYERERDEKITQDFILAAQERICIAETSLREIKKMMQEQANDLMKRIIEESKNRCLREIQGWLDPPEFSRDFERARKLREDGTATWLFDNPEFRTWKYVAARPGSPDLNYNEMETVLVVKGNPGCGKTVLAAAVVESLKSSYTAIGQDSALQPEAFYFFFRSGSPTLQYRLDAYCAITTQMLHLHRNDQVFIDKVLFAMMNNPSGQLSRPTEEDALELLTVCAHSICSGHIILDAIDECVDSEELISDLLNLTRRSGIKILLFSRPNAKSLYEADFPKLSINIHRATSPDIRLFLQRKLDALGVDGLVPDDFDTQTALDRLTKRADGMFLWAHLMITYLRSRVLTPGHRLRIAMSVSDPEGLYTMYNRISEVICEGSAAERTLAKRMIMLLLFASRALTTDDFEVAINIANNIQSFDINERHPDFAQAVVMSCGGLVEPVTLQSPSHGRKIFSFQFIHLSAKDYFTEGSNTEPEFGEFITSRTFLITPRLNSHLEISRICLTALTYRVPAQPLNCNGKTRTGQQDIDLGLPFIEYAAIHWIQHLAQTMSQGSTADEEQEPLEETLSHTQDFHPNVLRNFLRALKQFLTQKKAITAWIETVYTISRMPKYQELRDWIQWTPRAFPTFHKYKETMKEVFDDALEFTDQLIQLEKTWGENLRAYPGCIWDEASAFMHSRFLISSKATKVIHITSDNPWPGAISAECLCKISSADPDGHRAAVLSIWPSAAYKSATENNTIGTASFEFHNLCKGWHAQYEIWAIEDSPIRILQIWIPLDEHEVSLQIQHSLTRVWQEAPKRSIFLWSLQFPLAISPSTRMFTILRTVFKVIEVDQIGVTSYTLPFEYDQQASLCWHPGPHDLNRLLSNIRSHVANGSSGLCRGPIYKYWCSYSSDEQFISFMDKGPSTNYIAVFRIAGSKDLLVHCAGHLRVQIPTGMVGVPSPKMIFHAHGDLLAIHFGELANIWAFRYGEIGFASVLTVPNVQGFNFSHCGKYLIITSQALSLPFIQPIPKAILDLSTPIASDALSSTATAELPVSNESPTRLGITSGQLISPGQALQTTAQISIQDTSKGISVAHTKANVKLQLWQSRGNDFQKEVVELIKLPNLSDPGNTGVAIHMPNTKEGKLKVILSMTPKPWNGFSGSVDAVSQTIVLREMNAIRTGRRTTENLLQDSQFCATTRTVIGSPIFEGPGMLTRDNKESLSEGSLERCAKRRRFTPY